MPKINALCLFYKSTLLEFRSMHKTLQSSKFTPLQCQLVKFCICAEFLDTKLSEKSNFETPKFQARNVLMVIAVNYIPRFNFAMVSRILEMEKNNNNNVNVQRALVLNLVEISKDFLIFMSILLKSH